jgi:hypothetical protein
MLIPRDGRFTTLCGRSNLSEADIQQSVSGPSRSRVLWASLPANSRLGVRDARDADE